MALTFFLAAVLPALMAAAQPGPAEPALGPAAATAAGARAPVAVSFETDPRVELLSVLEMLARPEAFRSRFGAKPPAYAERARKRFAPFAGHAAAARVKDILREGRGGELTEIFLSLSDPPELAAPAEEAAAARAARRAEALSDARDFARRSGFARFYRENAEFYREAAERARAEAERGLRPDSVTGYLRQRSPERLRFIVAPLLPREMAANLRAAAGPDVVHLRVRAVDYARGGARLSLDVFAAGSAHDVGHALLDPLAAANRDALEAYAGLMFEGCAGTWQGCVIEQVDLAVTLRALAAERGEGVYEEMLRAYAGKYPHLEALCRRLGEWEARPDGAFADFYPRLTDVFREESAARVKDAAPGAAPPRRRRPR